MSKTGSRPRFWLGFVPTVLATTLLVTVGVYLLRVHVAQRLLADAETAFRADQAARAQAQLARAAHWAGPHPVLASELYRVAMVGCVRAALDDRALEFAARAAAGTPPAAAGRAAGIFARLAARLDPLFLAQRGGRDPDPGAVYDALLQEVRATGDPARAARVEAAVRRLRPAPPVATPPDPTTTEPAPAAAAQTATPPDAGLDPLRDAEWPVTASFALTASPRAQAYDLTGRRLELLPAATLLAVHGTTNAPAGMLAMCTSVTGAPDGAFFVKTRDLDVWEGNLALLDPGTRTLLRRHADLRCRVRERELDLAEDNPHAEAYREAREAYQALSRRAQELQARRDGATGADRMSVINELHALKGEAAQRMAAFKEAEARYKAWREQRIRSLEDDPEYRRLKQDLETVRQQLNGSVKGVS